VGFVIATRGMYVMYNGKGDSRDAVWGMFLLFDPTVALALCHRYGGCAELGTGKPGRIGSQACVVEETDNIGYVDTKYDLKTSNRSAETLPVRPVVRGEEPGCSRETDAGGHASPQCLTRAAIVSLITGV